jgi:gamma-glutamyl:cysteine ligase YbdK (ATP-grasp superfamily)
MADAVLQPVEDAQQQVVKDVTDDLAKIFAGIEMPARPAGASIAIQVIQEYVQQPDVAQRLQTDQAFQARLQKYSGQYTFQMQQAQNAQIGRVGTAPAQMGNVDTQNL